MKDFEDRRAGGTIPVKEVRSTNAMMRLAQSHVNLAERTAYQTRKIIILTRWVVGLAVAVALVGCLQIFLFLLG